MISELGLWSRKEKEKRIYSQPLHSYRNICTTAICV